MKNYEELKNKYAKYKEIFQDLEFERVIQHTKDETEEEERLERERSRKVQERIDVLEEEYMQWKEENGILEECQKWGEELFGYVPWRDSKHEYRDWMTDHETNKKVHESIHAVDEKEVEVLIENARKALESIGYTHDLDVYETHEYIDYIEYINRDMRHDIENGCMSALAMDILENRSLWIPYKEGFKECLEKVVAEIDETFLHFNKDDWDWEYEDADWE